MENFIGPLYDIVKIMCTPICQRVDYARNLSKNFTELSRRVKELCHKRDDIKDEIERVKLQKAPKRECNDWFAGVDEIEKKVKMIEDEQLIDKRCFKGWFPDVIARVKLGKHVVEMIEGVKELQEKSFEGGFVTDLPPQIVEKRPIDPMIMVTSTKLTLQKIVDSIRDEGVQKIGIWGMGGVGKTTLMKHLNNMPEIQTMFQIVIWVTISKSWSIRKIQDEVAMRLSLPDVKDKPDERVSITLSQKLEGKKYLLLLDDVWEWVDLTQVGIPSTSQEKGCKIVLTSRDINVCGRMKTDVNIKVEVLDKKEAWEMFMSQAGEIGLMKTIKPIAEEIVRKCGGLPLALRVAGGALRMAKDVHVWRYFLKRLNSPDMHCIEDMDKNVFKPLKASYDQLKDPNIKNCFLYCGLYPKDEEIKISRLITYWRAEGFLSKESLEDAYDDGFAKLHDLIGASLLEQCEDENHVRMHEVVRDLVLKMTAAGGEESRFMVRVGLFVNDKEWEEASRISFINAERYKLPECFVNHVQSRDLPECFCNHMPNCPMVSTLLLQSRDSPLKAIPKCFLNRSEYFRLQNYETLGILSSDLGTENVHGLKCFTALFCALEYIVDEDGLRGDAFANLEFLELDHIRHLRSICCDRLPMQLSSSSSNSFTKLKKLSVYECYEMKKVFSWGLIPQLLNLELLDIKDCSLLEEIVSADFHEEDNNRIEHVKLPKLKFLRLQGMPEFIGISKSNHLYLDWPSLEEVTVYHCPKLKIFPFDIHNAPNLRKINGQQQWWEALKLKDDATKSRFNPLFYEII